MGRPAYQPTNEQRASVEAWVKAKVSIEEMARRLEMTPKTFRKHFASEMGLIPVETVNTGLAAARPRTEVFRPTDEQRENVLLLSGVRWSRDEIAQFLGVSRDVFDEHFNHQFEDGPRRFLAEKLRALSKKADLGDTKAIAMCLAMNERERDNPDIQPAPLGLLGKKAAAAVGAQNAQTGTAWEELLPSGNKPN